MATFHDRWPLAETPATKASLTFFEKTTDGSERAFWIKGPLSAEQGNWRTNMDYRVINDIPIYDLREKVQQLSLDDHGFKLEYHPTALIKLQDEINGNKSYMDETAQLIKKVTNAELVVCYDLRVSNQSAAQWIWTYVSQYRENLSSKVRQELTVAGAGSSQIPDSPGWQAHVGIGIQQSTDNGSVLTLSQIRPEKEAIYTFVDTYLITKYKCT